MGFPYGSAGKESICLQCRRPGFNPCVGKIPWRSHKELYTLSHFTFTITLCGWYYPHFTDAHREMRLRTAPKPFPSDCGPLPQSRAGIQWARGWVSLRQLGWPGFISRDVRTHGSNTAPGGIKTWVFSGPQPDVASIFQNKEFAFLGHRSFENLNGSHSHALC